MMQHYHQIVPSPSRLEEDSFDEPDAAGGNSKLTRKNLKDGIKNSPSNASLKSIKTNVALGGKINLDKAGS